MIPMPDLAVTPYELARPLMRPGMAAFFSRDTSGLRKFLPGVFPSWRIKCDQDPPHECTHVGLIDVVRGRRVLIEATTPKVQLGPLSAVIGPRPLDGKFLQPYDGSVYVGSYGGCEGDAATSAAWDDLLLRYDYLDLVAMRLGYTRRDAGRYVCSELVAEALRAGGVDLPAARSKTGMYTPADLILAPSLTMLWRLK